MMFDMKDDPQRTLPQPNHPFAWVQAASAGEPDQTTGGAAGPALVCRALSTCANHLFTTRAWRLGGQRHGAADDAWAEVAQALGLAPTALSRVRQVHGAAVAVAPVDGPAPEADILVTNRRDIAVAVQAADCVPLLLADRRSGAVAAAHAGWRGLAAGVPGAAVAALARHCGSRPADLVAAIGPAIGPCCYEVGPEVREAFAAAFPAGEWPAWFAAAARPGHWLFDTWQSARHQLEAANVPAAQIFEAGLCTADHPALFCSYRRDGAAAGRMAAAIRSRPPRP
jgi:YfiH family protein